VNRDIVECSAIKYIDRADAVNFMISFQPEIVVHEIGHALGFYHEHNRWDRDNYIKIHYENIEPGQNKSFVQEKPENADFDHDYDYLSIMHYGQYVSVKVSCNSFFTIKSEI
jgi:hypothetical protein